MACVVLGRLKGQSVVFPTLSLELRYLESGGQFDRDRRYLFRIERLAKHQRSRQIKLGPGQRFRLAPGIWVHVGYHRRGKVGLVIDAPRSCTVLRREVYDRLEADVRSPADPTVRDKSVQVNQRPDLKGALS